MNRTRANILRKSTISTKHLMGVSTGHGCHSCHVVDDFQSYGDEEMKGDQLHEWYGNECQNGLPVCFTKLF